MGVSTDNRFVHKIWQTEELAKIVPSGVPYPMLADAGGKIGKVYGVYDDAAGVNLRGRFIIDPDGVIQAMEVLTPSVAVMWRNSSARSRCFSMSARPGRPPLQAGSRANRH